MMDNKGKRSRTATCASKERRPNQLDDTPHKGAERNRTVHIGEKGQPYVAGDRKAPSETLRLDTLNRDGRI